MGDRRGPGEQPHRHDRCDDADRFVPRVDEEVAPVGVDRVAQQRIAADVADMQKLASKERAKPAIEIEPWDPGMVQPASASTVPRRSGSTG